MQQYQSSPHPPLRYYHQPSLTQRIMLPSIYPQRVNSVHNVNRPCIHRSVECFTRLQNKQSLTYPPTHPHTHRNSTSQRPTVSTADVKHFRNPNAHPIARLEGLTAAEQRDHGYKEVHQRRAPPPLLWDIRSRGIRGLGSDVLVQLGPICLRGVLALSAATLW